MNDQTIVKFPGSPTDPESFCGILMENRKEIENIACVVMWKGEDGDKSGTTNVYRTDMKNGDIAWCRYVLEQELHPEQS